MNKLWYLKRCDIFQDLKQDAMQKMNMIASEKTVAPRQVISTPDDTTERMFILKKGKVRIYKLSPDGKMITLAILKDGDVFGALSMIKGGSPKVYAEALEESYVCAIKQEAFYQVVKEMPDVAFKLIEMINQKLLDAQDHIEDLVFRGVPARIASVIIKLAEQFGVDVKTGVRIDLKITHQELADMVGSTRETVTVVLNNFKNEGLIDISEKHVTLLDRQTLLEWAGKDQA